ncbi:MAG: PQQ-like beta-propeller repeat protein [Acidobacteria bacterium]|nr:PQQ-like beta-propeller repeat protein [Acidobacteriota bacterium]
MDRFFSIRTGKFVTHLLLGLILSLSPSFLQPLRLASPLVIRWSFLSDSLMGVAPTGDSDDLYLSLLPSTVASLAGNDGALRWKSDVGGNISGSPVFDTQRVYIMSEAQHSGGEQGKTLGVVRAISRASGVTLWVKEFTPPFCSGLTQGTVSLFACLDDGRFYSIDKLTGETRWMVQFPHPLVANPALEGDKLYSLTTDGYLIVLNQRTGNVALRYRTEAPARLQLSVGQGTIYYATEEGFVLALKERGGSLTLLWRKRVSAGLQNLAATPKGVLITTQDNFILFLESRYGKRLWKRQMPARLAAPPSLDNESALFAPIGEENCVALSLRDGKVINYLSIGKDNSVIASPLLAGDRVFIPTRKGLLAFAPPQSSPRLKPTPFAR